jgi:hypothetical protein
MTALYAVTPLGKEVIGLYIEKKTDQAAFKPMPVIRCFDSGCIIWETE